MMKRHKNFTSIVLIFLVQVFFFLMLTNALQAGQVQLAWDPNTEGDLAGYKLYYDGDSDSEMYRGTGATEGDSPVVINVEDLADAGSPAFTLTGLEAGQYYYFALTAFNTEGVESDFSDEVGALVEVGGDLNKTVDSSPETASESSGGSGSSGGTDCFISGLMGERAGSLPLAAAAVLLLMAAAAAARPGTILKAARRFHRRRTHHL